jgi:hypothetical protein
MSLKNHSLHILASRGSRLAHDDVSNLILDSLKAMGNAPVVHIFDSKFLVL